MSTLPGVPLYQALGYREVEPVSYTMPDGTRVDFVRMSHSLVDSEHRDTR
jgi:hypothetical protein